MQNYHLGSLRMLANIYQTDSGKDYMQGEDASNALINFCTFSLDSVNPKVVFTAAVVIFNHVLCYKRDKSVLKNALESVITKIYETITDPLLTDNEALLGLLLCECRIFFMNKSACEFAKDSVAGFRENHQKLKTRISAQPVKEAVNDVLLMLFDD